MKIYKISQNENIVTIMSLDELADNAKRLKATEPNIVSIRDNPSGRSSNTQRAYNYIDKQNFQNIFVATFDDLALPF